MDLTPLWAAPAPIPAHALAALAALAAGAAQLALPKGGMAHRGLGWIYVALLAGVATSGLFIHQTRMLGPFGPIHLLSLLTLWSLFVALRHAARGRIGAHARAMRTLYALAMVLTGAFTLLPGRVMHQVVFGAG